MFIIISSTTAETQFTVA